MNLSRYEGTLRALSDKFQHLKTKVDISYIENVINTLVKISIEAHKKLNVRMYCFLWTCKKKTVQR